MLEYSRMPNNMLSERWATRGPSERANEAQKFLAAVTT